MTRSERTIILAWSLNDAIRQPRTSMSDEAPRALSPSEWRLCPTCDGARHTTDRFGRSVPCVVCGGNGRYEIDAYTETRVATTLSVAEPRVERVGCSWCQPSHGEERKGRWDSLPRGTGMRGTDRCGHCDGTGWRTLTAVVDDAVRARGRGELVAWTMHGDWPVLLVALERLRHVDRRGYRRFLDEASTGEVRTGRARAALESLTRTLPDRLHVPAAVVEAFEARKHREREAERKRQQRLGSLARRARDREIREARRNGLAAAEVAARHGVSERTVRRTA